MTQTGQRPSLTPEDDPAPHSFNPCVTETFQDVPNTGVVLVPWRVFRTLPEVVHPRFHTESREIVCDGGVNVFMAASCIRPTGQGYLEPLTQSWVMQTSTVDELDKVTSNLSSLPTLLSAVLTIRSVLTDSSEIPVVIFISPTSSYIKQLLQKTQAARQCLQEGKQFSVEVDFGSSLQSWGRKVLGREFLVVGGRFCVTSGKIFNHMFDWSNVFGCIPCLPCGVIGSAVYRMKRKMKYQDDVVEDEDEESVIIGAKDTSADNQQYTAYLLMHWIKVFRLHYCMECRRRLPEDGYHLTSGTFCQCDQSRRASTTSIDAQSRAHYKGRGSPDEQPSEEPQDQTERKGSKGRAKVLGQSKSKKPTGPFAVYAENRSKQVVQRKKRAIQMNSALTKKEISNSVNILNQREKQKKAIFRYPKNPRVKSRRAVTPQFVEVEFKMSDSCQQQANKPVEEVVLPRKLSVLEDIDESEEEGHAFYFNHSFTDDQGSHQKDIHQFLNVNNKPVTVQPTRKQTDESQV